MNSRTPWARRGAHRTSRDLAGSLVPSLLAMLAVAALVVSLYVWQGEDADADRTRQAADRSSAAPMTTGSATPKTTPALDPPPSTATSVSTPPSAATTKKSSKPAASADVVGGIEVVVLNQTRRGGLAASVAELLRGKGWAVPATGNFRGQVPSTTVYYPDGAEAQARLAAAGLPTEPRIRPRFGNLSPDRLTVVVTDNYPS